MASTSALPPTGDPPSGVPNVISQPRPTTKGWSLNDLVESSSNFRRIPRTHYSAPSLRTSVSEHETGGTPLIIYGWNRHPRWLPSFNIDWLSQNGAQDISVRNVHNWKDIIIPLSDFIQRMRSSPVHTSAEEGERLYGKDAECPLEWSKWLTDHEVIPNNLLFHGSNDFIKFLPEKASVQTLMCYIGIGDTFTPFHKDLCASSGQNLMCYSENNGSSFWFMTKSSDAPEVHSYFQQLGYEVDFENNVVTLDELRAAPFEVYIAEQGVGDLVLVPPRSCHQVINNGGITIKTSWSRMSLEGLRVALYHELPIYHRVCRREIYKVKATIYHAMQSYTRLINRTDPGPELDSLANELKQLLGLFDDILAQEVTVQHDFLPHISQSGSTYCDDINCDFCGADIFQSFFECDKCVSPSPSGDSSPILLGYGLVICPSCYVEGRSCRCGNMQPVQCRVMADLLQSRNDAAEAIQHFECQSNFKGSLLLECPKQFLEEGVGVFESGCKLHQRRQAGSKDKTCSPRNLDVPDPASHVVPATDLIACKPCHFARCFSHLLHICHIHSVEAILLSEHDEGTWHQFHLSSKDASISAQDAIDEDERVGRRPNILRKLSHIARTFNFHRAVNSDLTKIGWYDQVLPSAVFLPPNTDHPEPTCPDDGPGDRPSSSEARLPDDPSSGPCTSSETTLPEGGSGGGGASDDVTPTVIAEEQEVETALPHVPFRSASICVEPSGSPSSLSVLTALPSEPSSPLSSLSDLCSRIAPENATPSVPGPSNPIPQVSTNGKHKQRAQMAFIEVPQPDWYRRMRGKEKANPKSLSRCHETPESDDMPLQQLVALHKSNTVNHKTVSPSHHKSGPSPRSAHGEASLNPPTPAVQIRQQATQTNPSPSKKRKQSQGEPPRPSQSAKRLRSVRSDQRPENTDVAAALNQSFQCNIQSKTYVSCGVQKSMNFTKATASDGPDHSGLQTRFEEQRALVAFHEDENHKLRDELQQMKEFLRHNQMQIKPSDSFSSFSVDQSNHYPNQHPVSIKPNGSIPINRSLRVTSARVLPRHPTPTEPRSHRGRPSEGKPWKHLYDGHKYKKQIKGPYSRVPGQYKGGYGRARVKWKTIPLELRLTDSALPATIMTIPSTPPAESSYYSPSSGNSSTTIQAQQDDSEEYSASLHTLHGNEESDMSPPALSKQRLPGGYDSEDEVSLGDEDEYLPTMFL